MLVYACTSNTGKRNELVSAAAESGVDLEVLPFPGLRTIAVPEETGQTFEENAVLKATYYSGFTPDLVLSDDSGLEVDALYGAPGVYSARYAGPDASDDANNNMLLSSLGNLAARTARFVCVAALARAGQIIHTARGTVEGEILAAPRGDKGFGYDPLFFYPPLQRSFAELTAAEKLKVSHRGRAMRALLQFLRGAEFR